MLSLIVSLMLLGPAAVVLPEAPETTATHACIPDLWVLCSHIVDLPCYTPLGQLWDKFTNTCWW